MERTIDIGRQIGLFTLDDQFGEKVEIPAAGGKLGMLLSFHPLAWTGICTQQMEALDKMYDDFTSLGVTPFGVSVDAAPTKKAWSESMKLKKLRLICDFWPHGALAEASDIFIQDRGTSGRGNVIIDNDGKIIWAKVYKLSEMPDFSEVLEAVRHLK